VLTPSPTPTNTWFAVRNHGVEFTESTVEENPAIMEKAEILGFVRRKISCEP
jgi:hypothetical protein